MRTKQPASRCNKTRAAKSLAAKQLLAETRCAHILRDFPNPSVRTAIAAAYIVGFDDSLELMKTGLAAVGIQLTIGEPTPGRDPMQIEVTHKLTRETTDAR